MTSREFQRLFKKYLLPELPGMRFAGSLFFVDPPEYLLRGLYFEGSDFDRTAFTVYAFVQPLYVPKDHIYFSYGDRLGCLGGGAERWWNMEASTEPTVMAEVLQLIREEGLPHLEQLKTPADLAAWTQRQSHAAGDPNYLEALGYSLALEGRIPEALEALDRVSRLPPPYGPDSWEHAVRRRVAEMRELLARDPEQARRVLDEWTAATATALRLNKR